MILILISDWFVTLLLISDWLMILILISHWSGSWQRRLSLSTRTGTWQTELWCSVWGCTDPPSTSVRPSINTQSSTVRWWSVVSDNILSTIFSSGGLVSWQPYSGRSEGLHLVCMWSQHCRSAAGDFNCPHYYDQHCITVLTFMINIVLYNSEGGYCSQACCES